MRWFYRRFERRESQAIKSSFRFASSVIKPPARELRAVRANLRARALSCESGVPSSATDTLEIQVDYFRISWLSALSISVC